MRSVRLLQHGFTTIELITVMVILGILAAVALPRLNSADFKAEVLYDQTVSALRYAQKTAVSHRRNVCVAFTATTVNVTIASVSNGACDTDLLLPGGKSNTVSSQNASTAYFSSAPATPITFASDGTASANATITVAGVTNSIRVVGTTGYVNYVN